MKSKTILLAAAALFFGLSVAQAASYKVSFFQNGQWKGDMAGNDVMIGSCTIIYNFRRQCNPPVKFYGCASSSNLYTTASSKNYSYKIYKDGRQIC